METAASRKRSRSGRHFHSQQSNNNSLITDFLELRDSSPSLVQTGPKRRRGFVLSPAHGSSPQPKVTRRKHTPSLPPKPNRKTVSSPPPKRGTPEVTRRRTPVHASSPPPKVTRRRTPEVTRRSRGTPEVTRRSRGTPVHASSPPPKVTRRGTPEVTRRSKGTPAHAPKVTRRGTPEVTRRSRGTPASPLPKPKVTRRSRGTPVHASSPPPKAKVTRRSRGTPASPPQEEAAVHSSSVGRRGRPPKQSLSTLNRSRNFQQSRSPSPPSNLKSAIKEVVAGGSTSTVKSHVSFDQVVSVQEFRANTSAAAINTTSDSITQLNDSDDDDEEFAPPMLGGKMSRVPTEFLEEEEEPRLTTPKMEDMVSYSASGRDTPVEAGDKDSRPVGVPRRQGELVRKKNQVSSTNAGSPAQSIPRPLLRNLFSLYSKRRLTRGAMDLVVKFCVEYLEQASVDMAAYCRHAGRRTITVDDAVLLMRRQRAVDNNRSYEYLVNTYLPMEYAEKLLPCNLIRSHR